LLFREPSVASVGKQPDRSGGEKQGWVGSRVRNERRYDVKESCIDDGGLPVSG